MRARAVLLAALSSSACFGGQPPGRQVTDEEVQQARDLFEEITDSDTSECQMPNIWFAHSMREFYDVSGGAIPGGALVGTEHAQAATNFNYDRPLVVFWTAVPGVYNETPVTYDFLLAHEMFHVWLDCEGHTPDPKHRLFVWDTLDARQSEI